MPWPTVNILDDLAPPAIDRQRRDMIGGDASVRMFPWVGVQQLHLQPSESPHKGRRAARQPRKATPRVAVCVAGAARALIHPLVWCSLERHVLGRSEGGEGGHDLFAVLVAAPVGVVSWFEGLACDAFYKSVGGHVWYDGVIPASMLAYLWLASKEKPA